MSIANKRTSLQEMVGFSNSKQDMVNTSSPQKSQKVKEGEQFTKRKNFNEQIGFSLR